MQSQMRHVSIYSINMHYVDTQDYQQNALDVPLAKYNCASGAYQLQ